MAEVPIDTRQATWTFVSTLARGVVAVIFIWAAVEKVADLDAFATSIRDYDLFPAGWTNVIAFIVPWIEIIASALLIFGGWRAAARLVIAALLLLFIALKIITLARGLDIGCGCVAEDSILAPLFKNTWGIVTNLVLLSCLAFDVYCAKQLGAKRVAVEAAQTEA